MEFKKIEEINEYNPKSIDPKKNPNRWYELYSVPNYGLGEPEIVQGKEIESSKQIVEEGDILICKINPRINRVWIVGNHTEHIKIASSEWIVVRTSKLNNCYLAYYFKSEKFNKMLCSQVTGIGGSLTRAQPKNVKTYQVPLLPLKMQNKVVEIIEELECIIKKRQSQITALDHLTQSIFWEMFKNIQNKKKISEITEVQTGATPSRENPSFWKNGTIPWIKTGEVKMNYIEESEEFITEEALQNSSVSLLPYNTILVAMYGQGVTRGRVGILKMEATTNQACAAILPSKEFNSEFLFKQLNLNYKKLRDLGRGGNQPNLNLSLVKNFEVILPKLELQNEFNNISEDIELKKKKLRSSMSYLTNLLDSLLQKAFKGELFQDQS